jgi:hypothetical protein
LTAIDEYIWHVARQAYEAKGKDWLGNRMKRQADRFGKKMKRQAGTDRFGKRMKRQRDRQVWEEDEKAS